MAQTGTNELSVVETTADALYLNCRNHTFRNVPADLEREFDEYCRRHVRDALEDNPDLFPDAAVRRIQAPATVNGQFDELFLHARREGIPLYVLIDEYDNFANTILAGEGAEAYYAFTHGGGFYRNYNTDMVLHYLKHSISAQAPDPIT